MSEDMSVIPPQHQYKQPGLETEMVPRPDSFMEGYRAADKLEGKIALISGGDSGIGRAVSIAYAKEGADVAFIYLDEDNDADVTAKHVEAEGRKCLKIRGDIGDRDFCFNAVKRVVGELGGINILINHAGEQHVAEDVEEISDEQLRRTFATNVFGMFYLTQAALKHMKEDDCIINTTSVVAYRGQPMLVDYGASKGAALGFTRSLAPNLVKRGIRVNAVAPGPTWTPLIPASFEEDDVSHFGESAPMGRVGQPDEVAPSYVFLASRDASYMTGQVLHPNGGWVVGG
ncbi:MAG: SDR family oxidoreductase [Alphaproteobacteria bacterium]|nr:SDR family oxidoreductase [Alphaproteobacteria bacterium]